MYILSLKGLVNLKNKIAISTRYGINLSVLRVFSPLNLIITNEDNQLGPTFLIGLIL